MSVFIGYPSFMAYQMMKGKKDNNEGFPTIPGTIARYSASGLTNEQMAANPVWVDKTGNGHDLQLKNFSWKGMSGIGGYVADIDEWGTNSTAAYFERNSIKITATFKENVPLGLLYHNIKLRQSCVLKVTGIPEGCDAFLDDRLGNRFYMSEDGVYEIIPSNFLAEALYLSIEKYPERWYGSKLTIEQLPLYPGALVFDGVDDYGTCDNFPILTKEKGYTVVALRSYLAESIGYLVYNGTSAKQSAFAFERSDSLDTWSWGINSSIRNSLPKLMSYQTSNSYNNNIISTGTAIEGDKLIRIASSGGYCNVAIWELVFLDHDATEEELTKIKDYFVKTYPWLFPDQAWTVVGKTNEDEDRATIANITGNGNDLVLYNLGFAEGSGYNEEGEYAGYLVTDGVDDRVVSRSFTLNKDWTIVGNWKMLQPEANKSSGIVKQNSLFIYNHVDGLNISINDAWNFFKLKDIRSVNAICSDGRIYLNDWTEIIDSKQQTVNESVGTLVIGILGNVYTSLAFKNLGIYNNQILSKDDCIKAYNYLQTLKAK